MNTYFYKIFLPGLIFFVIGLLLYLNSLLTINVWLIATTWFLIGPIGMGVGYHRLFSHRQFRTYSIIERSLAILGTLCAYSPLGIAIANHQYHHKHSDTNVDESAANKGLLYSLVGYRFSKNINDHLDYKNFSFKCFLKDKILVSISDNFYLIIYLYAMLLILIDYNLFYNLLLLPAVIEHVRLSVTGYFGHKKTLFSYRNFDTNDHSQNNYICGLLSLGLGWHNNHHHNPGQLNLREKWWEVDIESIIAKAISIRS